MSIKAHYQVLFSYHGHTTRRLLEIAAQLDEGQYHEQGEYGPGAIHDLFLHLLQADHGWRIGLETLHRPAALPAEDFASLESLSIALEQEDAAWQTYLKGVSDADVEAEISLTDKRGDLRTFPLWQILQHLILHGMQHHSELAERLTQMGHSPGNLDFIYFKSTS